MTGPPRVIAECAMDDLAALAGRLADGSHGASTGIVETADGPRLGLRSRHGAHIRIASRARVGRPAV